MISKNIFSHQRKEGKLKIGQYLGILTFHALEVTSAIKKRKYASILTDI
jgi:hypothetical protein